MALRTAEWAAFTLVAVLAGGPATSSHAQTASPANLMMAVITPAAADPLPSWSDGKSRQAIVDFVAKVTKEGSPTFVPVSERIATFDNDGTLWAEQPIYIQLLFVKALAPQHPEWKDKEPFKSVLAGDIKSAFAGGVKSRIEIVGAGSANLTPDEFDHLVKTWAATARHPTTGRLYTEMVYQPMLEVLAYLRANGFKTYITSGLFVRHTDAERELAYDVSPLGRLERGLEEAAAKGWTVVDMRTDWKVIFPEAK